MTTFEDIPRLEFFSITDEFGEAFFMKRTSTMAICIESSNKINDENSYKKGVEYPFIYSAKVKPD